MPKPNTYRCPKCRAKMRITLFAIYCRRCGYTIYQEPDKLTKKFLFG